jgi:hypothetical protein
VGGAPPAFVRSASLRWSHPLAGPRPFRQSLTNLAAADADTLQIPVAKTAQRDKVRLTLTMSDKGSNPTVDETTEARQSNNYSFPDCWRGVVWGVLSIVIAFPFERADPPSAQPLAFLE